MTTRTTEQARQAVPSASQVERPADLNNQQGVCTRSRRIHIFGIELGSPQAALHEASGLGPLTSEAIYDPATGKLDQIDTSGVSLFFNQAPHIAGPNQVPPAPG